VVAWLAVLGALALSAAILAPVATVAAAYDPAADLFSMASTTTQTGARAWWAAGYTGKGVDVAVIDTGVARVPGLDAPGKVVDGPDLSLDSQVSGMSGERPLPGRGRAG